MVTPGKLAPVPVIPRGLVLIVDSSPYLIEAILDLLCCAVTCDSILVGDGEGMGASWEASLGGAVASGAFGIFISGGFELDQHMRLSFLFS